MNKLKKIKKYKDEYLSKYVYAMIKHIKQTFNISTDEKVFYLGYKCGVESFLYKNKIIYVSLDFEDNQDRWLNNGNKNRKFNINILYTIDMLKEYPKTNSDIVFRQIANNKKLNKEELIAKFFDWIDSPNCITQEIDFPNYKVIKYLQDYKPTLFQTNDYVIFIGNDGDRTQAINFYVKIKNEINYKNIKVYIVDYNGYWNYTSYPPPSKFNQIVIDDKGQLSDYKKTKIKKVLLDFFNQTNEYFNVPNYYVLMLLKLAIVPIEYEIWWGIAIAFQNIKKLPFNCIFVDDFLPDTCEKQYFCISNKSTLTSDVKISVLSFTEAKLLQKDFYKQGFIKAKPIKLKKEDLVILMDFLKSPVHKCSTKTNWQELIEMYNYNTGSNYDSELPLDLPIPDYTKL